MGFPHGVSTWGSRMRSERKKLTGSLSETMCQVRGDFKNMSGQVARAMVIALACFAPGTRENLPIW